MSNPDARARALGSIDDSALSFATDFKNTWNDVTHYTLNIRWSTGRYTESFTGKDDKGAKFDEEYEGICAKLN